MLKRILAILTCAALILSFSLVLTGCQNASDDPDDEIEYIEPEAPEQPKKETLYPIVFDNTEILVGETTVQTVLDGGLRVTIMQVDLSSAEFSVIETDIMTDLPMEANTFYSGAAVRMGEVVKANVSLITGDSEVPMSETIIGDLELDLAEVSAEELAKIKFNGVALSEMTFDKAKSTFPEFDGDETEYHKEGKKYSYSMSFENGALKTLKVARNYTVEYDEE